MIWYHFVSFLQAFMPEKDYFALFQHAAFSLALANTMFLDVFFLISGYVISYSLMCEFKLNAKIKWRDFFIKRVARVYPSYLVMLLCLNPKGLLLTIIHRTLSSKFFRPFGQLTYNAFLIHPLVILMVFGYQFSAYYEITRH